MSTHWCDNISYTQPLIACPTHVIHVSPSTHNEGTHDSSEGLWRTSLRVCTRVHRTYMCTFKRSKGVKGQTSTQHRRGRRRRWEADTTHQSRHRGRNRHLRLPWFLTAEQPLQAQPDKSRRSRQNATWLVLFHPGSAQTRGKDLRWKKNAQRQWMEQDWRRWWRGMEEEEESNKRRNEDKERGVEKRKMKKELRMLMKCSGEIESTSIHIHTRNYETFKTKC